MEYPHANPYELSAFNHHRPSVPSLDTYSRGDGSVWGDSASYYADSDMGPVRRGPPRVENEIPRVGKPLLRDDDEVSSDEEQGDEDRDDFASTVASFSGDLSDRLHPHRAWSDRLVRYVVRLVRVYLNWLSQGFNDTPESVKLS